MRRISELIMRRGGSIADTPLVEAQLRRLTWSYENAGENLYRIAQAMVSCTEHCKRDLLSLLTGGAALGLSIFNTIQVTQLSGEMSQMQEDQKKLAKAIKEEDLAITKNSKNIKILQDKLVQIGIMGERMMEQVVVLEMLGLLDEVIAGHVRQMMEFSSQMELVRQGMIPITLFEIDVLRAHASSMVDQAARRGLSPARPLIHSSLSYFTQNDIIHVMLHQPFTESGSSGDLYEFLALPLPVPDQDLEAFIDEAEYRDKILYISRDRSSGLVMTAAQLQAKCTHTPVDHEYHCLSSLLLDKGISQSCLGALFLGTVDFHKACHLKVRHPKTAAVWLPDNKLVVMSPNLIVNVVCGNATETYRVKGRMTIPLVDDCRATSTDFDLSTPKAGFDFEVSSADGAVHEVPLDIDVEKVFNTSLPTKQVAAIIGDLMAITGPPERDLKDVNNVLQRKELEQKGSYAVAVVFGIALLALVPGGLFLYCGGRRWCLQKRGKKAKESIQDEPQPGPSSPPELQHYTSTASLQPPESRVIRSLKTSRPASVIDVVTYSSDMEGGRVKAGERRAKSKRQEAREMRKHPR